LPRRLRLTHDGGGLEPSVTVNSPDGEIEFVGAAEIRAAASAMRSATRYAEAFGPPVPLLQWRQLNG
jgi:hypothetical protein